MRRADLVDVQAHCRAGGAQPDLMAAYLCVGQARLDLDAAPQDLLGDLRVGLCGGVVRARGPAEHDVIPVGPVRRPLRGERGLDEELLQPGIVHDDVLAADRGDQLVPGQLGRAQSGAVDDQRYLVCQVGQRGDPA